MQTEVKAPEADPLRALEGKDPKPEQMNTVAAKKEQQSAEEEDKEERGLLD